MKWLRDKKDLWLGWVRHLAGLGRSVRPDAAKRAPVDLGDNFPVIDLETFRIGLRESWLAARERLERAEWEDLE